MKRYIAMMVLIIFVIVLVGLLGFSCNKIIQKNKQIDMLTEEVNELKNTMIELDKKVENNEEDKEEIQQPIVEPEEPLKIDLGAFKQENLKERDESTTVYTRILDENNVIGIEVDGRSNSLNISTYAEAAKLFFGYTGTNDVHTITGFGEKIVDARILATGNTPNGIKVVLLMENGSVKYIKIGDILNKTYTVNTVENATDIIRIVEVMVEKDGASMVQVVGLQQDGTAIILKW